MGIDRYKEYYKGAIYHIFNRGADKQKIFLDTQDYSQYIKRLRVWRDKHKISLVCYCLMPNHIHLAVRQNSEEPIYKFMQSLHTSYGAYFNKKYRSVGSLWQDRFKQRIIGDVGDLLYLSFYIHLNPLLDGLVENLKNYPWSSYLDFCGIRQGTLCAKEIILDNMGKDNYLKTMWQLKGEMQSRKEFRNFIKLDF